VIQSRGAGCQLVACPVPPAFFDPRIIRPGAFHLKILAIAEHFPSPYKPYHFTQFAEFVAAGHELTVAAFGRHAGPADAPEESVPFVRQTRYLPSTLKDLPRFGPALLRQLLRHPIASLKHVSRAMRYPDSSKRRLLNACRAMLLPDTTPDFCIVHNLRAVLNVQFLKQLYPNAVVTAHYHGGELPGVPVPSDVESRRAFRSVDIVFTNTEYSRRHAVSRGADPQSVVISRVGFDLGEFPDPAARGYRQDGRLNLLMAGRLGEEKGFSYGLQAFKRLLDEDACDAILRIAGEGPKAAELRKFVADHGLTERVEFLGRLDQEQLRAAYRQADIFLLPSVPRGTWEETQACVIQEALLMRSIAAVSRTGGVPESTAPAMLPYSFDAADVAGMTESLRRLARLPVSELKELGEQGRRFVEQRYDIRILNRELLDVAQSWRDHAVSTAATVQM
jgi:glycosyltransferase involved in cell wall biosynthesis